MEYKQVFGECCDCRKHSRTEDVKQVVMSFDEKGHVNVDHYEIYAFCNACKERFLYDTRYVSSLPKKTILRPETESKGKE